MYTVHNQKIKSNQIFISPAATDLLYTVDIVLYSTYAINTMWMVISIRNSLMEGAARIGMKVPVCTRGPSEHNLRGARWCLDYVNNN
jgi:hypothetical protein